MGRCTPSVRWILAISTFLVAGFPGAGCTQSQAVDDARSITEDLQPASDRLGAQDAITSSRRNAIVVAAEKVSPAVVSVNVVRLERVVPRSLWEEMMLPPGVEREIPGLGSGFIIHESGLVITNEHVIRGADDVRVTLPDGREFEASVVGVDEVTDLAVLRITFPEGEPQPIPVAPLGDSDDLMIGEWVIAIGSVINRIAKPFGTHSPMTRRTSFPTFGLSPTSLISSASDIFRRASRKPIGTVAWPECPDCTPPSDHHSCKVTFPASA